MKIKGSGEKYYEVNLNELTCNCKDWSCRRHNFSIGDEKRLCKHLLEAKLISSYVKDIKIPTISSPITNYEKFINCLSYNLKNCDIILRYSIGGEIYRRSSILTQFIPVVIQFINDSMNIGCIEPILGSNYRFIGEIDNLGIKLCDGPLPIAVILSNSENFLFKSVFYDIGYDNFTKLSSISMRNIGLILSEYGFMNKNGSLVNLNIHTIEELMTILDIDELI